MASAPNSKVIFLPLEATGLIGAIGGIAEIARSAFAEDGADGALSAGGRQRGGGSVPSAGPGA